MRRWRASIWGKWLQLLLTDAAGELKGLFEAQKRLAGNKPSFANSVEFKRQSEYTIAESNAYIP